jgi:hypothetical protein
MADEKNQPAFVLDLVMFSSQAECGLTKKAEPPPTRDVNRDSGTASANGGWLRRLVRHMIHGQLLRRGMMAMPTAARPLKTLTKQICL